jgi:putative IMPACT (imprinted ancient) family translation regulator
MSKLKILVIFVLSVIIGSAIAIVIIQNISKENPEQEQVQQTNKEKKKVPTETQERVVITNDDRSHNEALSSIEMPGHKVEPSLEKEVKEAFKVVIKECKTANILEIDYSIEKHLKMAKQDMIMAFAVSFQQNGYDVNVDDIEVYESSVSDVVQFIVKSTKDGEDSIFWTGNYNTMAHQISISHYYGGHVGKAFG